MTILIYTIIMIISLFFFLILNLFTIVISSKFIDEDFNVYKFIDNFLIEQTTMYIMNKFNKSEIKDDDIPIIYEEVTKEYVSTISNELIKKISLYIRKDKIHFIMYNRLLIVVPNVVKEHNSRLKEGK